MDNFHYFKQAIEPSLKLIASGGKDNDQFEKQWLEDYFTDFRLKAIIVQLSILNIHTLQAIVNNQPISSSYLSRRLGVTKGAISKSVKRLTELQLITQAKEAGNRKTIYYHSTSLGTALNSGHTALEKYLDQQVQEVVKAYSPTDLKAIARFLQDIQTIHHD